MNITTDEFLSLAKKYQALGSSTQRLLEDVRRGSFKVQDGVRLRQLYEFLLDLQFVQGDFSDVHEMTAAVGRMLAEHQDEEEEKIVAERWVPEKGFPGATLWVQREDEKWTIAPSPKEGACIGKCVKDIAPPSGSTSPCRCWSTATENSFPDLSKGHRRLPAGDAPVPIGQAVRADEHKTSLFDHRFAIAQMVELYDTPPVSPMRSTPVADASSTAASTSASSRAAVNEYARSSLVPLDPTSWRNRSTVPTTPERTSAFMGMLLLPLSRNGSSFIAGSPS